MELKHISALTPSTLQIQAGGEKSDQNLTHRDGRENKSQVSLGKKGKYCHSHFHLVREAGGHPDWKT